MNSGTNFMEKNGGKFTNFEIEEPNRKEMSNRDQLLEYKDRKYEGGFIFILFFFVN